MTPQLHGIHHITAIASDPQRNIDFYAGVLGLRLVKVTVNFDDPGTYHLYYGDAAGTPGTLLTFFPWAGARRGRRGTGQVAATAFSIPEHAVSYWIERLKWHGVTVGDPAARLDEEVLVFFDPDGLALELVAHAGAGELSAWERGPVPADQAIRGFHGVTLWEEEYAPSASVLADTLGFGLAAQEGSRYRHRAQGGGIAALVDVLHVPKGQWGQGGAGTVHHVAWRTPDDAQQLAWQRKIAEAGLNVTPVQDRQYFHSIYFREPGGVLYEVATNPPGFAIDEPLDRLGTGLMLPPWLEPQRRQIEETLPAIQRPALREDGHV